MFFYEVGYTTWEECPITTLWHEREFTQDEFNQILLDCYAEADKINKVKHDEWFTEWAEQERKNGHDEIYINHMSYKPRVSDMNRMSLHLLVSKYGFHHMNITAQFIPTDNYDLDSDRTDDELVKMIKDRLNIIEPRDNKINDILDGES